MITNLPFGPAGYFKSLRILHLAMLAGQVLFCGVAAVLVFAVNLEPSIDDSLVLNVLVPVMAVAGAAAGMWLFRNRLEAIDSNAGTGQKLNLYRTALILKYALLEAPALIGIILFILTGTIAYLAVAGMLIGWFAMQRPERSKALFDLRIDESSFGELEREP